MTLPFDQFAFISDLVRRRSGIQLEAGKEYLVEARLLPLAKAAGLDSVDAYVRSIRTRQTPSDLTDIVEALTTNETSWFRDVTPFNALRRQILPALRERGPLTRLKVWSAACSTGQEPYSIAMTLLDELGAGISTDILATDLNNEVLAKAREGVYSKVDINRGLPAPMLVRHFVTEGSQWRISPTLRQTVRFAPHNLLEAPPLGGPFDIVFLRNVLIYFDVPTKRNVLERVAKVVSPGGFLVLGGAETVIGLDDIWERIATERGSVYRRTSTASTQSPLRSATAAAPVTRPAISPVLSALSTPSRSFANVPTYRGEPS